MTDYWLVLVFAASAASTRLVFDGAPYVSSSYLITYGKVLQLKCIADFPNSSGSYVWSRSFGNTGCSSLIVGLTSFNLTTPLTGATVTCYQCAYVYVDANGTSQTSSADPLLFYPYYPANSPRLTLDLSTAMSVNATCNSSYGQLSPLVAPSTFVWTRAITGSQPLVGGTSKDNGSTLEIVNSTSAGGVYYCHALVAGVPLLGNTANGVEGALLATFDVRTPPHVEIYPVGNQIFNATDNVTVTCKVLGYPTPDVVWLKNSAVVYPICTTRSPTIGGVNISYTASLLSSSDSGTYVCLANQQTNSSSYYVSSDILKLQVGLETPSDAACRGGSAGGHRAGHRGHKSTRGSSGAEKSFRYFVARVFRFMSTLKFL